MVRICIQAGASSQNGGMTRKEAGTGDERTLCDRVDEREAGLTTATAAAPFRAELELLAFVRALARDLARADAGSARRDTVHAPVRENVWRPGSEGTEPSDRPR